MHLANQALVSRLKSHLVTISGGNNDALKNAEEKLYTELDLHANMAVVGSEAL